MSKKISNLITFGLAAAALSFALCASVCAFFIAADHLTLFEFRRAVLREQWFWLAVVTCVVLSFYVRNVWSRQNEPRSASYSSFTQEVRREPNP